MSALPSALAEIVDDFADFSSLRVAGFTTNNVTLADVVQKS